jgi:hypothetical protein
MPEELAQARIQRISPVISNDLVRSFTCSSFRSHCDAARSATGV